MKANLKSRSVAMGFVALILLVGIPSCFDENWDFNNISDEIEISPAIAIPLAHGKLTLNEIITEVDSDGFVKSRDTDSLLYIVYSEDILTYSATDIIEIPDQDVLDLNIPATAVAAAFFGVPVGGTVSFPLAESGKLSFTHNEKLDSLKLKTFKFRIVVNSTFRHDGVATISSDKILENGIPFSRVVKVSDKTINYIHTNDYILNNVTMIFDNTDPLNTKIPINFNVSLTNSGNPVLPGQKCDLSINFLENSFSSVYGYLGDYDLIVTSEQIDISMFNENIEGGTISFADPQMILKIDNSFGIPVDITLSNLNAISTINSSTTPIGFKPGANPFFIGAPLIGNIGTSVSSEIIISNANATNIIAAMETMPNRLTYTATAEANPTGHPYQYNFATDSSSIDLEVEAILPIWVKATGFEIEETVDFDYEKEFGTDLEKIEDFALTLKADNGLPIEANLQVYFTNMSGVVLDSMFRDDNAFYLKPAEVVNEKVTTPSSYTNQVIFTADDLEKIKTTKKIILKATANTPLSGTNYFKFYSYYDINFELGARVKVRINSKDL